MNLQWEGLSMVKQAKEPAKMRKSVINRGIKRTLSTAQYETLVIEIGFEEEIEWSTLSERQKKIDNWNTVLLQDFKQSSDRILADLGITHKKAYFKNPTETTQQKYKVAAEAQERGLDLDDVDDLDSLDTLGA
ncbi:MAG: hypothetical protein ACXAC5_00525 [Promethearchaeota archaeon]|jgi:hypothetical protein